MHRRDYYLSAADGLLTQIMTEIGTAIQISGRSTTTDTAPRIDALANAAQAFIAMAAELREGEND